MFLKPVSKRTPFECYNDCVKGAKQKKDILQLFCFSCPDLFVIWRQTRNLKVTKNPIWSAHL
jgi:hypothetical protein